jgi:peptidoglycan hydrolase-like protein with peptidoglycan-binding domain
MTWHVARSLEVLRQQLNERAPNRNKAADGGIGDAEHASRDSDHNPWYRDTVTARDYTHDPKGGLNCDWLASVLVASGDPRIKYVIWDRRIWEKATGWKPYHGTNPHTHHLHLSVKADPSCESAAKWNLGKTSASGPRLAKGSTGNEVRVLQVKLRIPVDGDFGPQTESAVRAFQRSKGLVDDGIVGPATWAKLG